jgi:restriction system protein
MQFKMRENSVFAKLLRSPWWVSMLVGGIVALVAAALFAEKYAYWGIFIALPFFVIGTVRAWRQMQEPSQRTLAMTDDAIRSMSPREFTDLLTSAYIADGYAVTPSKGRSADLKLEHNGRITLVSCKRVKAANTGVEPLRALVAAGESQDAAQLVYFTLGGLSLEALEYAAEQNIDIPSLESLSGMLGKHLKSQ